jgi:SAM-dependent methyltransferase
VGCGEGGNLFHLRRQAPRIHSFGVDFSVAKATFAHRTTRAPTAVADATSLPFKDGSFDAVLIRDLLHHLPDRLAALKQAYRVLRPGGHLLLIEPNRRSPLVLLQAALVKAERGLFSSTRERLRNELRSSGFELQKEEAQQPLPIGRLLLHPHFGATGLARYEVVRRSLLRFDRCAERLIPMRHWLYLILLARRPELT